MFEHVVLPMTHWSPHRDITLITHHCTEHCIPPPTWHQAVASDTSPAPDSQYWVGCPQWWSVSARFNISHPRAPTLNKQRPSSLCPTSHHITAAVSTMCPRVSWLLLSVTLVDSFLLRISRDQVLSCHWSSTRYLTTILTSDWLIT